MKFLSRLLWKSIPRRERDQLLYLVPDQDRQAFLKALISVGFRFPLRSAMLSTGPIESKAAILDSVRRFVALGVELYATQGTADFLARNGVETTVLRWPLGSLSSRV